MKKTRFVERIIYLQSSAHALKAQVPWQRPVIDIQNERLHLGLHN